MTSYCAAEQEARYEHWCEIIETAGLRFDQDGDEAAYMAAHGEAAAIRPSAGWLFDPSHDDVIDRIGRRVRRRVHRHADKQAS